MNIETIEQYFHLVFNTAPILRKGYMAEPIYRCLRCNDLFGESGPDSVRDRNWNLIDLRACPNDIQGDMFREDVWRET